MTNSMPHLQSEDCRPKYSASDLDLLEEKAIREARASFWAFRRYMNPKMKVGWFQRDLCRQLQQFFEDLIAGKAPYLLLCTPPQHGKSETVTDFLAWLAGKLPDDRTIYASYSNRLGVRANSRIQRLMDTAKYKRIFPATFLNATTSSSEERYQRNKSLLEYVGKSGSFRNTTVAGGITGEGMDLGVIDDPIKGRKEAQSELVRENTWAWVVDDFMSRFSERAGLIMILTRWHFDDPAGRLLEHYPETKVIRYPAIADKDAKLMPSDPREPGENEPLFPELKSAKFLAKRRAGSTNQSWASIYQQTPLVSEGQLFPPGDFNYIEVLPSNVRATVRYWDKAGTQGGGAYTVGVRMHLLTDGRIVISGVERGQLGALQREKLIKSTAVADGSDTEIWIEQEPGSGGKESAENTVRMLRGYAAFADRVTGDKVSRAEPYAAQVQGGNVYLVRGSWNKKFVDEHEVFPVGTYKDQVDAASGAFMKLVGDNAPVSLDDFQFYGEPTRPDF